MIIFMKKRFMIAFHIFLVLLLTFPLFNVSIEASSHRYWVYAGRDSKEVISSMLDFPGKTIAITNTWKENDKILGIRSSENGNILLLTIQSETNRSLWTFFREDGLRHQLAVFPSDSSIPYGDISRDGEWIVFFGQHQNHTESWLMKSDGSYERALGSHLEGAYARAPSFSWDSQSVAYVYGPERLLFVEDILSAKATQITQSSLGPAWNPNFLPGDQELYVMITPYRSQMTLFKIHRYTMETTQVWKTDEAIVGAIQSRTGAVTAFMSIPPNGKTWKIWGMSELQSTPWPIASLERNGNSFSLQLSFDGQWLLYRCDGLPIRVAKMDASLDESLHRHLGFQNVSFAAFYTQNPFPPSLEGRKISSTSNLLEWTIANQGSLPLASFQLFRKTLDPASIWEFLQHVAYDQLQVVDTSLSSNQQSFLYRIRAVDIQGNVSFWSNEVLIDRTPPMLEIVEPPAKKWLTYAPQMISGKCYDLESGLASLSGNDIEIRLTNKGDFKLPINPIEGINAFHFKAIDNAGNYTELNHDLWLDTQAPVITINSHQHAHEYQSGIHGLSGKVIDNHSGTASLRINDKEITLTDEGFFNASIHLQKGENIFSLEARDKAGNSSFLSLILMGLDPVTIQCWIGSKDITINGKRDTIDAEPFIHISSSRTLVPVRFMVEPIDSIIEYDADTQIIHIRRYRTYIRCQIGKTTAMVNGIEKAIDENDDSLSPLIKNNRTYLPLRFIAENLGFKVEWNSKKQQIDLFFPSFNS